MYQGIYNCICQNTKKIRFIIHYVKPTAQLLFKIRFPKGGPTCRRQVVNNGFWCDEHYPLPRRWCLPGRTRGLLSILHVHGDRYTGIAALPPPHCVKPKINYRILESLNIRMRGNQLSRRLLTRAILHLHEHGHSEAGYKTIWRVLNVTYGLRVTQRAVRTILQVVDPEGVRRRTAHRFRCRAYHGHGPNGVIHIDGYDKLKPFGIAIHGAIFGYSRKILWLQACPSNNDPRRVAH